MLIAIILVATSAKQRLVGVQRLLASQRRKVGAMIINILVTGGSSDVVTHSLMLGIH